jgi:hypothetical protein
MLVMSLLAKGSGTNTSVYVCNGFENKWQTAPFVTVEKGIYIFARLEERTNNFELT